MLSQLFNLSSALRNLDIADNTITDYDELESRLQSRGRSVFPTPLRAMLDRMSSMSSAKNWLTIWIISRLFRALRRVASFAMRRVTQYYTSSFTHTVTIPSNHEAYRWLLYWLSKRSDWAKSHEIVLTNDERGVKWNAAMSNEKKQESTSLLYMPLHDTDSTGRQTNLHPRKRYYGRLTSDLEPPSIFSFWFKRHYVTFKRSDDGDIQISVLAGNQQIAQDLILEAGAMYKKNFKVEKTSIYACLIDRDYDSIASWHLRVSSSKRSWDSVILEPAIKDKILSDARNFLSKKTWYADRNIPFRRGYLLHGAPGAGKTSLISAIAGELGLDIYQIRLSQSGLDDSNLATLFQKLPVNCVAVIEDIDVAMSGTLNRDTKHVQPRRTLGSVTLSGLLNALDGIGAQEGRLLFATTNKIEHLDEALTRPGRMDVHIKFKLATKYQIRELFKWFYKPMAIRAARDSDEDELEKLCAESPNPSSTDALDITVVGDLDSKSCDISMKQVDSLADKFVDAVPNQTFSMACLQGYLMGYRTDPVGAACFMSAWVENRLKADEEEGSKEAKRSSAPLGNDGDENDGDSETSSESDAFSVQDLIDDYGKDVDASSARVT